MIRIGNLDLGHLISSQVLDKVLLDHVGLPHVLVLAVHLVNLLGWMGKGDHSKTFLQLELY